MEHIKNTSINNTTKLIGIKDLNIKIALVLKHQTHIEIKAELDYPAPACPHCQGKMIKYDFQRPSTIPILDVQGMANSRNDAFSAKCAAGFLSPKPA